MNGPVIYGPPAWVDLALCPQVDPDLFFPDPDHKAPQATALCRSCECRVQCLEWALDHNEAGVWGGFSERSRQEVRRLRNLGVPVEDIIADDDARHYARIESRLTPGEAYGRKLAAQRENRRIKQEAAA